MAQSGLSIEPSYKFAAVTTSDTAKLTYNGETSKTKGIFVGGAGNLTIKNDLGSSITFTGVLAGVMYPFVTDQIMATGTSATSITALY